MMPLALIAAVAALGSGGTHKDVSTTMLRQWTPHNQAEMRAADPVALSYVAKGWLLVGDTKRANVILDELQRRGDAAFGIGVAWAAFGKATPNPADTVYTVTAAQVADAFRVGHRSYQRALSLLRSMPLAEDGCIAYDALDADRGCVNNVNGITAAFYSYVGVDYQSMLQYEERTIHSDGSWFYDEALPQQGSQDAGHQAWTAFMLLQSPDPAMRALGHKAAVYVETTFNAATEPPFAGYAVAAASIADGDLAFGCPIAMSLPQQSLDQKNAMWAAYVYTWAQVQGC